MKPEALPEYDLSNLAGPGVGGGSGRAPKPLPAPSFLMEEKMEKDHLRGTLSPLKIPLWGSPLAVSPTPPRPGSLVVTTGISRAKGCAFYTEKLCSL